MGVTLAATVIPATCDPTIVPSYALYKYTVAGRLATAEVPWSTVNSRCHPLCAAAQVKLQPLRLNSAQPSLASKLVAEQQQLAGSQPQQQQQQQQPVARQPDQWLPFGVQPQQESGVQVVEVQRGEQTHRWSMSNKLKQELDQAG